DGDMDVITSSEGDNKVSWHENTDGAGTFSAQRVVSVAGIGPRSVSYGDLNGDSHIDLITPAYEGRIVWFQNVPPMTLVDRTPTINQLDVPIGANVEVEFDQPVDGSTLDISSFKVSGSQSGIHSGDYSGDGTAAITFDPDQLFMAGEVVTVTLNTAINSSNGSPFSPITQWQFTIRGTGRAEFETENLLSLFSARTRSVAVGDVDNDGDPDVVTANDPQIGGDGGTNHLFLNNYDGTFQSKINITDDADGSKEIRLADIDNDGDLDVLVGNLSGSVGARCYYNLNNGLAWFGITFAGALLERGVATGDVDLDGDIDVILGGGSSRKLYKNQGNGIFDPFIALPADPVEIEELVLADIDNDNDLDLIAGVGRFSPGINRLYLNDGLGNFAVGINITTDSYLTATIAVADLNGDGYLDIIAGNGDRSNLIGQVNRFYLNDGNGNFTTGQELTADVDVTADLSIGDVDGDGYLDIIAGNTDGSKLYLNDGNANFGADVGIFGGNPAAYSVAMADIDGDGGLDLIAGRSGQNRYYRNPPKAAIGNFVWDDLNANGEQDGSEPGVEYVTVELFDSGNSLIDTETTNASGQFLFSDIDPGDYYVKVTRPIAFNEFSPQNQAADNVDSDANPTTGQTAVFTLFGKDSLSIDIGLVHRPVIIDPIPDLVLNEDPPDQLGYADLTAVFEDPTEGSLLNFNVEQSQPI
ncbi:MAG: hypothetical protein GY869_31280, partial [Planctomycetes bacterium]|nr:hypothetical protein [Planctomycetota bacterium]